MREPTTGRDVERRERLSGDLCDSGLDAVIATTPENVLLLTGYFPVVGTSIALATRDGEVYLLAPHDERELAETGGADEVIVFQPASLDRLTSAAEAVRQPLCKLLRDQKLERATIGWESGELFEPASYVSMHLYGSSLSEICGSVSFQPAAGLFARMKATLTAMELDRVRRSCRIASLAFEKGRTRLAAGLLETEAAANFRRPLFTDGVGFEGASRADGYVFCMAGEHSAEAFGAYARSRASTIRNGDFVLTHCNSHADGYWTDITRTYCMGQPNERQQRIYDAVFEARQAAIAAIRPGVEARNVDRAARDVMRSHGFGDNFKHPTGHGVGFAAIDHNARPRLHPASEDRLESGMVFNIEPAAYLDGFGGVRHCDMVTVAPRGCEVLTPCHCVFEDLMCDPQAEGVAGLTSSKLGGASR